MTKMKIIILIRSGIFRSGSGQDVDYLTNFRSNFLFKENGNWFLLFFNHFFQIALLNRPENWSLRAQKNSTHLAPRFPLPLSDPNLWAHFFVNLSNLGARPNSENSIFYCLFAKILLQPGMWTRTRTRTRTRLDSPVFAGLELGLELGWTKNWTRTRLKKIRTWLAKILDSVES